jgi:gliding motility-associated-like protein
MKYFLLFITLALSLLSTSSSGQLTTGPNPGAAALADLIGGTGVTISGAVINCANNSIGTFNGIASNLGMPTGVILSTGNRADAPGPDSGPSVGGIGGASTNMGTGGYAPLNGLAGAPTQDACRLEFDVESRSSYLEFRYVFASEEYPEFVNAGYNDAFGFFISGPGIVGSQNIALLPGTTTPVTIDNVNAGRNAMYFRDNVGGATVEYDGMTTVLTAFANVIPCKKYHLILAIADAGDGIYDSGIFIEEASLTAPPLAVDSTTTDAGLPYIFEGCYTGKFHFSLDKPAIQDFALYYSIKGNAVNGEDYEEIIDSLVIPAGEQNGFVEIIPIKDALIEQDEFVILCALDFCDKSELSCDTLWIQDFYGSASGDTVICSGGTAPLHAEGSDSVRFKWTPSSSLDNDTISDPTASPTNGTTMYIVEIYNGFCSMFDTVIVNLELPVLQTLGDTIFCPGGSALLNAELSNVKNPENSTYSWTPSSSLDDPNIVNPIATPSDPTWYFVTAESERGCEMDDSVFVDHYDVPLAEAGVNDTTCGYYYNLLPTPSMGSGWWSSSDPGVNFYGYNNVTYATVVVPTDGIYTFYWEENNFGCTDIDSVTITFIDLPPADAGASGETCGLVYNLDAAPTTGIGTWTATDLSGSLVACTYNPNANDPKAEVTSPVYDSLIFNWSIDLVVCVSNDSNTVLFKEIPMTYAGVDDSICDITYTLNADTSVGNGQWSCVETNSIAYLDGSDNPNTRVTAPSFGTFNFIWTEDNLGCVDQDTVSITFSDTPIPDAGIDDSICGLNNQLNAIISFGVGTWSPSIGLTDPTDPNTTVTVPAYGCYTYYWTESYNICSYSDSVTLCFFESPVSNAGNNDTVCGTKGNLLATSSVGFGTWLALDAGNTNVGSPSNPISSISLSTNNYGTYYFVWSEDNVICSDKDTASVTFYEIPVAVAGQDDSTCGLTNSINALPSVGNGMWQSLNTGITFTDPTTALQSIDVSRTGYGTYTFVWSEDNAICSDKDSVSLSFFQTPISDAGPDDSICSQTIQICANPSVGSGFWTGVGSGFSIANPSNFCTNVTVTNYGSYQFIWSEFNVMCGDADTTTMTFFQTPISNAGSVDSICGLVMNLNAKPSVGSGIWTCPTPGVTIVSPTNPSSQVNVSGAGYGNYFFTWTEVNVMCSDSDKVNLIFHETPNSSVGTDTVVCGLNAQVFSYPSVGSGMWSSAYGTTFTPSITDSAPFVSESRYGTFRYLWTENNFNCIDTASTTVAYHQIPVSNAGTNGQVCGLEFILNATPSVGNGLWTGPDGASFSDTNNPSSLVTVTNYDTLTFVWQENNAICSSSDSIEVIFYAHPNALFRQSRDTICTDDMSVYFNDESELAFDYYWTFGDGKSSNTASPEHEYDQLGSFVVTLYVSDLFGCLDTAYSKVLVENCAYVYVANAFTPNSDNVNDVFVPKSSGIRKDKYTFTIYDRWGKLVFASNIPNTGWDGFHLNGKLCQQGNYAFIIEYATYEGLIKWKKGSVTLYR